MKRSAFIINFTFFALSGIAQLNTQDSIRMQNNITSMTEIRVYFESDAINSIDTIWNAQRFNRYGQLIEEKYQIGTHVLHKYIYDSNNILLQEFRFTSMEHHEAIKRPDNYPDTITKIDYKYQNDKIVEAVKSDYLFRFIGKTVYSYNSDGNLVLKYDIDTSGNVFNMTMHKYRENGYYYSLYNHQQMTTEVTYEYFNGKVLRETQWDDMYKSIVQYNVETQQVTEVNKYLNSELISVSKYFYNSYGLVEQIIIYEVVGNLQRKYYEYKFIYNKE